MPHPHDPRRLPLPLPPPPAFTAGPVDDSPLPPGAMVGEYRVQHLLGQTAVAQIYAGLHPLLGRRAALEVLTRLPVGQVTAADRFLREGAAIDRFLGEVRAVNEIGHPNIVDVVGFGRLESGRYYVSTEWLRGETLAARLRSRRLSLDESLDILDQIADGLEAAHDQGIAHRELSPSKVQLIPVRGRRVLAKLLDFGIATLFDAARAAGRRTRPEPAAPGYVSPEQVRGDRVDHRSDVYALGVIAYEMILGRPPFEADVVDDLMAMHLLRDPPPPRALWPEIPAPLDGLLTAMLEKEPLRRPHLAAIGIRLAELTRRR